jgi:hypothetical protein
LFFRFLLSRYHNSTTTIVIPITGPTTAPAIQLLLGESVFCADGALVTIEDGVAIALVLLKVVEGSNLRLEVPAVRFSSDTLLQAMHGLLLGLAVIVLTMVDGSGGPLMWNPDDDICSVNGSSAPTGVKRNTQ